MTDETGAGKALLLAPLLEEGWDDALERAVRAAAVAVDAPIAVVSVLSPRLEHFVAHVGLPPELEVSRAVARELAFGHLVAAGGAPLVVVDTALAASLLPELRPELVDSFDWRSCVAVPVFVGGVVVGALCALDRRARPFGDADVAQLAPLSTTVAARLSARWAARRAASSTVATVGAELSPYLRLLRAVQVGALDEVAMARALRVLPPVPQPV